MISHQKGKERNPTWLFTQAGFPFFFYLPGLLLKPIKVGRVFLYVIGISGAIILIRGEFTAGIWWILTAVFLRESSGIVYKKALLKDSLKGDIILRYMRTDPVSVPYAETLDSFLTNYIHRYNFQAFPVSHPDKKFPYIHADTIQKVPRDQWASKTVGDCAMIIDPANALKPSTDCIDAILTMSNRSSAKNTALHMITLSTNPQ